MVRGTCGHLWLHGAHLSVRGLPVAAGLARGEARGALDGERLGDGERHALGAHVRSVGSARSGAALALAAARRRLGRRTRALSLVDSAEARGGEVRVWGSFTCGETTAGGVTVTHRQYVV